MAFSATFVLTKSSAFDPKVSAVLDPIISFYQNGFNTKHLCF